MTQYTWKHPGTFMSHKMTHTLRQECQTVDRKQMLDKLLKETKFPYAPRALTDVNIGYEGKGVGHDECTKDGEHVVASSILYWATGNTAYAKGAIAVIKAWSNKNKTWGCDNGLLEAAWSVCSMARGAELLKYARDDTIRIAWKAVEPQFFTWLSSVIMPCLKSTHIWRWKLVGNWHFSQICARMQIAILREDREEMDWCLKMYPLALDATFLSKPVPPMSISLPVIKCVGEHAETCRDITHAQFNLGGMVQVAEMAFHQGISLYDERLADTFELHARIMMKDLSQGLTLADIKTPYGYWPEPVWHIAYAHFVGRLKRRMPYTDKFIKQLPPDRVCFHWGPNCLTHYQRANL